jgi:F-type H+-transporting ATPase subunit a
MRKTLVIKSIGILAAIFVAFGIGSAGLLAGHGHDEESKYGKQVEPISKVIIHHVMDNHDWHLADVGETAIALHLPWIVYNSEEGIQFFMNTHKMQEEDPHYLVYNENLFYVKDSHHPVWEGPAEEAKEYEADGKYVVVKHHYEQEHNGEKIEQEIATVYEKNDAVTVIDFSMTKTALQILLVALLMLWIFTRVAKAYKKRDGMAPKGLQSLIEPLIVFVREDVAKPYLHGQHDRFLPYLLSLFFFIWIANLFGLTPFASNIAGNTTVTLMLAMITLVLIIINSKKDFWMHILWFPGVPIPMKPLMFVVELMGFITKPVALAIRLFANISAGHFMVLSLISLIFILGKNGESIGGAIGIMPLSIAFSLFIFGVELIVAAVQAFVFCLLTAVFIGQAMEVHHEEEHHEEHIHVSGKAEVAHT